jgi:hypothetical protein
MIILFVAVIPFFLHMMGFHCDSQKQVQTTSILNFYDNLRIATADTGEIYNSSKFTPAKVEGIEDCVLYIRPVSGNLYYTCTDGNFSGCVYVLLTTKELFADVPVCVNTSNFTNIRIDNPTGTRMVQDGFFVFGDAYRRPDSEISWFRQTFTCNDECTPPTNYFWNHLDGTYECANPNICGLNNTRVTYTLDQMLKNAGAERLYYETDTDKDYKAAVKISCNGDFQPNITIFRIPIFDYKLWILFFTIGILFFFLNKIKQH